MFSKHPTLFLYMVVVAEASLQQTKTWAALRQNGYFFTLAV